MHRLNTIFFGTPDFCTPSLEILHHHPRVNLLKVVSMPDRKAGRGKKLTSPAVIEYAKKNKLDFLQTENINREQHFISQVKQQRVDIFIVLAFAQFLNENLLNLPALGAFNIHTSLLPKYRGAAPIQYALLNNEHKTGVCIQKMVKKMDAGDIAHQSEVSIFPYDTGGYLYTRLKNQAALSLSEFIDTVLSDKLQFTPQTTDQLSFAPEIKKEDGKINFLSMTNKEIETKVRAFTPWPGSYCQLNNKRLKILNAKVCQENLSPGEVSNSGRLIVGCRQGSIQLTRVQLEGKSACSDKELIHGLREKVSLS